MAYTGINAVYLISYTINVYYTNQKMAQQYYIIVTWA